jgi:predicted nucleic acid-binding protein
VYAVDVPSGPKAQVATSVVEALSIQERLYLTPQVILEFFRATVYTRGRAPILTAAEAVIWIDYMLRSARCLPLDESITREAVRAVVDLQMSIFDAQMLAAARLHEMQVIITEDLPGGRTEIDGVRYINPFARSFTLEQLGL